MKALKLKDWPCRFNKRQMTSKWANRYITFYDSKGEFRYPVEKNYFGHLCLYFVL